MDEDLKVKWEELREKCRGSVYQSVSWAEIKKSTGEKPVFVTIEDDEKLIAGIEMFEYNIKAFGIKRKIIAAGGLPLFLNEDDAQTLLKKIKKEGYFYATISPGPFFKYDKLFLNAGYKKVSNNTIIVDIKKDKEVLWNNLEKKSIRWGIKTAEKNWLKFDLANNEDVQEFYKLYSSTAKQGGFHAEPIEFLENLRDTNFSRLFVIKKDDKIIAGGLILIDKNNKTTTLDLTGAGDEGLKLQAMPFLYWNIMLYSKENGLDFFDLGGYDAEAKEGEKTYNINKFKERFGGEIRECSIFCSNYKYALIRKLMKKMHFLKKTYRKD